MRRRVYIDTTIPSYAVERRADIAARYRRSTTRRFLAATARFDFFVSDVVRAELARGAFPRCRDALGVAAKIRDLPIVPEVVQVASVFRENLLVPSHDIGDSLHLAIAVVHRMDALATWNYRHLANPRKRRHLAVLCGRLGLAVPDVAPPDELLEEIWDA